MFTANNTTIKLWPVAILAAINNKRHGAARIWVLARALDSQGSGKVKRSDLWDFCADLSIGERKRRRWLRDAINFGLLREHDDFYYLAGLAPGALALGCQQIGKPATLAASELVRSGWRAHVWSAYLATLNGRPMSQEAKQAVTGIDPRTQRNYQAALPGEARRNYAETDLPGDHAEGLQEHSRESAFVGRNGRVIYRLPDQRMVPEFIAQAQPKGRSRKAQKLINLSFSEKRDPGFVMRLFHETHRGVEAAIRKISRADIPPWEQPTELFELIFAGKRSNLWQPVSVQS